MAKGQMLLTREVMCVRLRRTGMDANTLHDLQKALVNHLVTNFDQAQRKELFQKNVE
jgi:hypothetical protein